MNTRIVLTFSLFFFIIISGPIFAGSNYYIDATHGNDSNTGLSEAAAWRTIAKINSSTFFPGDSILFKKGEEWREILIPPSSGAPGNPITFSSYGSGEKPIINGSDLITAWSYEGGNIWSTSCTTEPNQVFFNGNKGANDPSPDSVRDWHWNSNTLYVYSISSPDEEYTKPGIEASVRNACINGDTKDYLVFDELHLRHSNRDGFVARRSTSNMIGYTIKNCTIEYNWRDGIYISGDSASYNVQSISINNNICQHNGHEYNGGANSRGFGVQIECDRVNGVQSPMVYQNTLQYNATEGIRIDQGYKAEIFENFVYKNGYLGNTNSGIMIGSGESCKIYRNWCSMNTGEGIFLGNPASQNGGHELYYNVLVQDGGGTGGITISYGVPDCKIYNNTIYGHDGGITIGADQKITGTFVKNNIFDNLAHQNIRTYNGTIIISDYNRFDENEKFRKDGVTINFSEWKSETGNDINSTAGDPGYNDGPNHDFLLKPLSPCIDGAVDVTLTEDYAGSPVPTGVYPDIGAYEYQGSVSSLEASINATPTSGQVPLQVNFSASVIGGISPYSYSWNFGDGNTSSEKNPTHTYTQAGQYTASLTVTDNQNNSTSDSLTITSSSSSAHQLSISAITGSPSPGSGGTTSPSPGNHSYSAGSSVQIKALPKTDYRFSKWKGDISSSQKYTKQITIPLDKNKSIHAYFYTKCGDVNGDLNISPADSQKAFDLFLGRISNPTESERENADVNCDGTATSPLITPADAHWILKKYIGKKDLPCDCSCSSRSASVSSQMLQAENVGLIINQRQGKSPDEIVVSISIDKPHEINAFGFDLLFPAELLEFVTVERTELSKDFYQLDANKLAEGVVRIGGYSGTANVIQNSQELIKVIFRIIGDKKQPLSFDIQNTVPGRTEASFSENHR